MKVLITLLLLLTTTHTIAEEIKPIPDMKEYDVEIIIFEDAHARYLSSQTWDQAIQNTGKISIDENTVVPAKANPANFKSIKPSTLNAKYKRVSASSEYNILFYGSWRQAGLDKEHAFEIDINDLKNNHNTQSKNILSGKFKLILTRYLHIYSDLEYVRKQKSTPENALENIKISDEVYPLKNHRRMRSKELHYIDHPLVGILVQINPVETKAEDSL